MRHRQRPFLAGRVSAVAIAVAVLAGCSAAASGPGNAPVASLSGSTSASPSGQPLTERQSDQDMVSFTRCMRSHGVQMSDPVHRPGHAGLSIDMPERGPATSAAYAACTHFMQAITQAKAAGAAAEAAPRLGALTRYAQCMRSHAINMLDPTPQGDLNLGNVPGITSDFGRYSPQFRAADAACTHFLPAGIRDDGTGP
ncbi:MAG TPA: hypothetical protein VGD83_38320 [Streptosporangiaceae bacterium]